MTSSNVALTIGKVLGLALLLAFFVHNAMKALECDQAAYCLDAYWAEFWTMSYADGFVRRAFLGTALRGVFGNEVSALVVNAIAFTVIAALVLTIASRIWQIGQEFRGFILAAFLVGPTTMVFLETAGDPLHICFLLMLLIALFRGPVPRTFVLVALPLTLLHEASLFLFFPALLLIAYQGCTRRTVPYEIIALTWLSAVGFTVFSSQSPLPPSMFILGREETLIFFRPEILPDFAQLLAIEIEKYSGPSGAALFVRNLVGAVIWPLIFAVILSVTARRPQILVLFGFFLLCAAPLYVIAHDWGRFVVYALFAAILVATSRIELGVLNNWPFSPDRLAQVVTTVGAYVRVELIVVGLFVYDAHRFYRVKGLMTGNITMLIVLVVLCLVGRWFYLRRGKGA